MYYKDYWEFVCSSAHLKETVSLSYLPHQAGRDFMDLGDSIVHVSCFSSHKKLEDHSTIIFYHLQAVHLRS